MEISLYFPLGYKYYASIIINLTINHPKIEGCDSVRFIIGLFVACMADRDTNTLRSELLA